MSTKRERERGNRRLLNVAKALRESPNPDKFTMGLFGTVNGCVTPACALGHYASRPDLQRTFKLEEKQNTYGIINVWLCLVDEPTRTPEFASEHVQNHFDISEAEADELFSPQGCDEAREPVAAAAYIEAFVLNRSTTP
jgi:hypothetical protein